MDDVRRGSGTRRSRLNRRRRQRNQRYGRFLGLTALGTLIPGSGFIAAGKRRLGTTILVMLGFLLAAGLVVLALVPQSRLMSYAGDRQMMLILGGALTVAAAVWLLIALCTHRSLEPEELPAEKRLGGALIVVLAASVVVAPMAVGARYAFTQRDFIGSISSTGDSHTTPTIDEKDPWADKPQLNVLFLGGDAGEGRDGLRPDTQIVASIDTKTGATTMISLPRNMQSFSFPADSPLAELYPNGFAGPGDSAEWMLNAVYRNVPAAHPEVFEGVGDPGADASKWAVEGALGIDIDYFMMVDLAGFEAVVDALGGITVDVPRDIPWGNKSNPDGTCTKANGYITEGKDQRLDGFHALWFARSRCGSDDYERMERQRCVMNAIVAEADPRTLLSKYQSLASTAGDIITTDVPAGLFPALIELMLQVKGSTLESLTLDNKFFASMGTTSANPDFDAVHARVAEILSATPDDTAPVTTTGAGEQTGSDDESAPGPAPTDADDAEQPPPAAGGTPQDTATEGTDEEPEAEPDQPVDTGVVC